MSELTEEEKRFYNLMPDKCKLTFQELSFMIETNKKNPVDVVNEERRRRMECYKTNKGCKWSKCILNLPPSKLSMLRCPVCKHKLNISNNIMMCMNCGYTFKYIPRR